MGLSKYVGAITITPTESDQPIPRGYHNGAGIVEGVNVSQIPDISLSTNLIAETPVFIPEFLNIPKIPSQRISLSLASGNNFNEFLSLPEFIIPEINHITTVKSETPISQTESITIPDMPSLSGSANLS